MNFDSTNSYYPQYLLQSAYENKDSIDVTSRRKGMMTEYFFLFCVYALTTLFMKHTLSKSNFLYR